MKNYIKIIDNVSGEEVYTVMTDYIVEELQEEMLKLAEQDEEWDYESLLLKLGDRVSVLDVEEIYI